MATAGRINGGELVRLRVVSPIGALMKTNNSGGNSAPPSLIQNSTAVWKVPSTSICMPLEMTISAVAWGPPFMAAHDFSTGGSMA